jgi:hypothetical protein
MKKIVFLLVVVLTGVFASAVENGVTAEGEGLSKREALMAAQRMAIEKGVGVLLDAQTLTQNMEVVKDEIYSKARGYVKHFTIVSEQKQNDGRWRVTIRCAVAEGELEDNLRALGILRDKMGNPRIGVVYGTENTGAGLTANHPVVAQAYEGIVEHLTGREFPIVADGPLLTNKKETAEYRLIYTVKQDAQAYTGIFYKSWVMISVKIIDTSTQKVIANLYKKAMGVDKNAMDFAERKAARKAGRLAAKFLEQKVVKRWQGETVAGREVVLEIHNIVDYTHLVELRAKIKDTDGVEKILQRNSKPNSVHYAITYNGDTDTLTETVYNILKHMGLEPGIPVAAGNSIKFRLNPVK